MREEGEGQASEGGRRDSKEEKAAESESQVSADEARVFPSQAGERNGEVESEYERAAQEAEGTIEAEGQEKGGGRQPHLEVLLIAPLSETTISEAPSFTVAPGMGTQLSITTPPGGGGELRLEFGEEWRCASAKLQLEQASFHLSAALYTQRRQHELLIALLGSQAAKPTAICEPFIPAIS
ncbi:MAG: hypothetical protein SGPRY_004286 [Prymnesium sp.]